MTRVGHFELLLRSTKDDENPTRLDLMFSGVAAVKLRTELDGVVIRTATRDEEAQVRAEAGASDSTKLYILESDGFVGYLLALAFDSHEDEGDYSDPSYWDRQAEPPE